MIKLNLWPEPDRNLTKKRAIFVICLTIGVLVAILQSLYLFYILTQISFLKEEINRANELANNLQLKNKESRDFEKTAAYLKTLADEISQIKLNQLGISRLLIEISKKIPDQVWLTSLEKRGLNLKLEGYSVTDNDLASFQRNLESTPLFDRVDLIKSVTVYLGKQFAYDSITRQLMFSLTDQRDQGKFANFIQTRAQNLGVKVIKGTPPAGVLSKEGKNEPSTRLAWSGGNQTVQAGIYLWSKSETAEVKNFVLEAKINFQKLLLNQDEN